MNQQLNATEVYWELIDDCFLNIWFVDNWEDPELFVINREVVMNGEKVEKFLDSYQTEYCDQSRSCGNSIASVEFQSGQFDFKFNETGKENLGMEALTIHFAIDQEEQKEIELLLNEMLDLETN